MDERANVYGSPTGSPTDGEITDIKPSLTIFHFVSYDSKTDESVVRCLPMTGRTHQIRINLAQGLGLGSSPGPGSSSGLDRRETPRWSGLRSPHRQFGAGWLETG